MSDLIHNLLFQYWGYTAFRGIQESIIRSVLGGKDTLGLMPTGGGKSICFQVPALAKEGMCLVISPLISLIKDQVEQLKSRNIPAESVHSGKPRTENERILTNAACGAYKFLYLSPERLQTEYFRTILPRLRKISLICVDEAHCVSQWGYDFRPAYLQIASLRQLITYHVPLLALTATATPKVAEDIQLQLGFATPNCIRMSFERKNIAYVVRPTDDKYAEILHILQSLYPDKNQAVPHGSTIIYTRSRKATTELAEFLTRHGHPALGYHAGLSDTVRTERQEEWTHNKYPVIVATNAFGMGIDKPDVRLVIHLHVPDSLEAYFQEAGRAGRDGKKAYAVLLVDPNDPRTLRARIAQQYPDPDYVRKTYENVCCRFQIGIGEGRNQPHKFAIEDFCRDFHQFPTPVDGALHLLHNAGYIEYVTDNHLPSRLRFNVTKEQLYRLDHLSPTLDALITALLRTYSGLFADFSPIDEVSLERSTGLHHDQIYEHLKYLDHLGILTYIPHDSTPTITLLTPRQEMRYITLPPTVYKERREAFAERIERVIDYCTSSRPCRSQQLLAYFGQTDAPPCGQCDVCARKKKR